MKAGRTVRITLLVASLFFSAQRACATVTNQTEPRNATLL